MATTVTIGGADATDVTVASATSLTCTVPAGTDGETVDVVVSTSTDTATLTDGYTYRVVPVITSVTPTETVIPGGEEMVCTGTDLDLVLLSGADPDLFRLKVGLTGSAGTNAQNIVFVSPTELRFTNAYFDVGPYDLIFYEGYPSTSDVEVSRTTGAFSVVAAVAMVEPAVAPVGAPVEFTASGTNLDQFTEWGVVLDPDPETPDKAPEPAEVLTATVGATEETTATFTVALPEAGVYNIVGSDADGNVFILGTDLITGDPEIEVPE